jgi:hypothetical protein
MNFFTKRRFTYLDVIVVIVAMLVSREFGFIAGIITSWVGLIVSILIENHCE